jgi:hypothetical protein
MNSAGFDPAHWSHWLLIGCFLGLSSWGLYLSWQWRNAAMTQRQQAKLARRLAREINISLNNANRSRLEESVSSTLDGVGKGN